LDIERKEFDEKDSIIYYNYSIFVLKTQFFEKFFKKNEFL
jgi:predicted transcriptional regulator